MSGYWLASPFRNELDMLEAQLHEFGDRLKGVVICEATTTQLGRPKPLHYKECDKRRFARWLDKIHYIAVDLPGGEPAYGVPDEQNWHRERYQRDMLVPFLQDNADPDDIVINADIDEFVSTVAFETEVTEDVPIGMKEDLRGYAVDYRGTPGVTSTLVHMMFLHCFPSLSKIRELRETWPMVDHGGWHLSWLGGPDAVYEKIHVTPHQETYDYGMRALPAGELYGGNVAVDVPRVSTIEERDALPWPDRVPLWAHKRLCPKLWWSPQGIEKGAHLP